MKAYVGPGGFVFTTKLRIVHNDYYECDPKIIAEPGDIVKVKDGLLYNLSRAAFNDPRVVFNLNDAMFVGSLSS